MKLIPGNDRLLRGVRVALRQLDGLSRTPESAYIALCAGAILDELTLRENGDFYRDYAQAGLSILGEAASLAPRAVGQAALDLLDRTRTGIPEGAPEECGFHVYGEPIETLRASFAAFIAAANGAADLEMGRVCRKILQWEIDYYSRAAHFQPESCEDGAGFEITAEKLQTYLRGRYPGRTGLSVTAFRSLPGGFQKLTIAFEIADDAGQGEALVLRGEQPDKFVVQELGEVVHEYAVIRIAHEAGLPVAEPLWCEPDERALGRKFIVSRKIEGINYGSAIGATPMPREVARSFVETLFKVHAVSLRSHARALAQSRLSRWVKISSLRENTLTYVHETKALVDLYPHSESPSVERVYRWLLQNVPEEEEEPVFLHGDYGPHNILVLNDRVSAILDWESARIGDPAADIAFLLQGSAGQITTEEALQWYREAGGRSITEYRIRYFEVVSTLRYLISMIAAPALLEADRKARNEWALIAFKWMYTPMSQMERKIAAAEAAKAASR